MGWPLTTWELFFVKWEINLFGTETTNTGLPLVLGGSTDPPAALLSHFSTVRTPALP